MSMYTNRLQPALENLLRVVSKYRTYIAPKSIKESGFGSFTQDCHARRMYLWMFVVDKNHL